MAAADMRNNTIVAAPGTPQRQSANPQSADSPRFRALVDAFRTEPSPCKPGPSALALSSQDFAGAVHANDRGIAIGTRAVREVVPANPSGAAR